MSKHTSKQLYQAGKEALTRGLVAAAMKRADTLTRDFPRDHNGWVLRGQALIARGYISEALENLEYAVKLQPKNAWTLNALGHGFLTKGDHIRAIQAFDKALKQDPTFAHAIAGKANSYELQGNRKRARKVLRRFVDCDEPLIEVAAIYARLLSSDAEYEEAVEFGERSLRNDPPDTKHKRDLLFAMASACEKSGHYEDALQWGTAANAVLRVRYDHDAERALNDRLLTIFDDNRFKTLPRTHSHDTSLPVFIVGRPRSGSTLTERILDAHPDVHGAGELPTLALMTSEMGIRIGSPHPYPECVEHLQPRVVEAESRAYIESVARNAGGAHRVVDKHLGNYPHLGVIHAYFPGAHVLHTTRDALDTCVSCFFERLLPTHIPWASSFEDLAFSHAEYLRVVNHFRDLVDVPMMDVSYEQLIAEQETVSREIISFCELAWDDRCLEFHKTARNDKTLSYDQVRQPIYTTAMGRASRFGNLLDPLREALERHGISFNERATSTPSSSITG